MMTRHTFLTETRRIAESIDGAEYPQAAGCLAAVLEGGGPVDGDLCELASILAECDRPKRLPAPLAAFIVAIYELEIDAGNPRAMNDLGALYYGGDRGFEQDFTKAVRLYRMAAERGERHAQENLGYCYYYGRNMERDYEKAFHYFALGAFDGRLISLYKIGDMYLNGYYVERNEAEAFAIYNRCLELMDDEQGKDVAGPVHLRLGDMYLRGLGTEPDPEQALLHYSLAEIMLFKMVKDGDYMYKKSLRSAVEGQERARSMLAGQLPGDEWTFE